MIDNTQTVSQFPKVHQNVHAGLMSHQVSQTGSQSVQNVPIVYSMGQNDPASVSHFQHFSQTGSHNVQTPHNVPSVFGVGQNGPASVSQFQHVS